MINLKFNKKGVVKNKNSGITLISLVVTIIVLLILAGISISMLSGDNSILQRATTARENTERVSIIEQAQTDILGQQTENKSANITKGQLVTILNKYFKTTSETIIPDEISATNDLELTTIDEKYKINLSQIYVGAFNIEQAKWTYNHSNQTVTNGTLILNIGDYVIDTDNQVVNGFDGIYRVLGVENEKLLLITASGNVMKFFASSDITEQGGTITQLTSGENYLNLSGDDGIINGESILNNLCKKFEQNGKFENGRSININDVNKITGYNPKNIGIDDYLQENEGTYYGGNGVGRYGRIVIYKIDKNSSQKERVFYSMDNGESWNSSSYSAFVPFGSTSKLTIDDNPIRVENSYYKYYATSLTNDSASSGSGIEKNSKAYDVLFNIDASNDYFKNYWLASPVNDTSMVGQASWGFRVVNARLGLVNMRSAKTSNGGGQSYATEKYGVRAVVSCCLKNTLKYVSSIESNGIKIFSIGSGTVDASVIESKYLN